nr:hypothetical protein [Tanacetum cinerariifolium]GEV25439.1 hypothetical protein [Tanacetum cinerariifolium]
MTTLTDKAILSGADNRPPILEKDMYELWKSRMELYMMNRQHGRMILESVEQGPLIWPTIKENGVTQPRKYSELTPSEAIQADCDERIQLLMQGTSLTKQERECKLYDVFDKFAYKKEETLRDFYLRFSLLLNDMTIYNVKLEQFQVNTKFLNTLPPEWSKFVTDVKLVWDLHTTNIDQLHAYLGQHEFHANKVRVLHERNSDPLALVANHQLTQPTHQEQGQALIGNKRLLSVITAKANVTYQNSTLSQRGKGMIHDPRILEGQATQSVITHNVAYQADDLDAYDSNCDEHNTSKIAFIANLSHFGLDALAEVKNSNFDNNMLHQGVQERQSSEQLSVVNHTETVITSDSNIIPYSQYVYKTQQEAVQNSTPSAQQDALILSVIEQLQTQVMNFTKINLDNKSVNDTLTAELERYKEQVMFLKEGKNVDFMHRVTISDSCEQSKARQLEPKLYDGDVIQTNCAIVIPDSEETLLLAKESRSKMILKQKDPMVLEKKVNTKSIDYAALSQLSKDFATRFVPQSE